MLSDIIICNGLNPEELILLENSIGYLFFSFWRHIKDIILFIILFSIFSLSILITPILFANFRISLSLIIIQINYRVETVKQLHFFFVPKVLPQIWCKNMQMHENLLRNWNNNDNNSLNFTKGRVDFWGVSYI